MSETVKEVWPGAHVVADKFYVIQLLTQSIFSQGSENKHKTIRHKRRLFMTIPEKLKNDKIEKRETCIGFLRMTTLGGNPRINSYDL